jgi:membrane-bound inhibitor of C-type lysozyme
LKKLLCLGFTLIVLTACEQETAMVAQYRCDNGVSIRVEFKGGKQVTIISEAGNLTLPRVESASGVKYEAEGVIFLSKGVDAGYSVPGQAPTVCRR